MEGNKNCYLTGMRKSVHSQFRILCLVTSQKTSVSKIRVACPPVVAA